MGEGELLLDLQNLAKELNIADKVIFTGYIKNPHNVLQYSEMFVFSSLFEGLGNVLLEALAFNMPIISTDCIAGPREILAPETSLDKKICDIEYAEYGILVPVLDDDHFDAKSELTNEEIKIYDAIIKLHYDVELRLEYTKKAIDCLKHFEKDNIMNQWQSYIENEKFLN